MKRFYLLALCLLISLTSYSQVKRKKSPAFNTQGKQKNTFLEKQWWLGFKGGINFTGAVVEKSYAVISPTNFSVSQTKKTYDNYAAVGSQATVEVTFYFKGFNFSLQPTYRHSVFSYTTHAAWHEDNVPMLELNYHQDQQLDYAEFPFLIKYDIMQSKLRPYVQVGAYYTILLNANKSVELSGVDYASGAENEFTEPDIIVGADDIFAKYSWGLMAGAGVNYHVGNIRLNLDLAYRKGMSLANATEKRYSNDRLTGAGDVMDDIKLNNFSISIGCLFPLRFLTSGFQSLDRP
jgi:hypothetical protein